jgi:predicted enzyme related to lactoylglutathione lyase
MARVTGIGGVFFRSADPAALAEWYREALGLEIDEQHNATFRWSEDPRAEPAGLTVWAPFPADTPHFAKATQWMVNFRVDDLEGTIERLRGAGTELDGEPVDTEEGRFAWAVDPEGNKFELWQPPDEDPGP